MNAVTLVNGFLSYLVLMLVTLGVAFIGGTIGVRLKKKNDAKKAAQKEAEKEKEA